MSRRKKRTPIPVEDRSKRLPITRLTDAMLVLQEHDYDSYLRVVASAEALAAIHTKPDEPAHEFQERVRRINPARSEVN